MGTFTLPGDVVEDLVKVFRSVVPQDVGNPSRADSSDDVYALAEMMAIAKCVGDNWVRMARVTYADGPYLELHAQQVGMFKQFGELDENLRQRIRTPPLAVTPDLIQTALQQLVDNAGGGTVYIVELPRDGFRWSRQQCWSRGWRWSSIDHGIVVALIPSSAEAALGSCTDALRAKVLAGKTSLVQFYLMTTIITDKFREQLVADGTEAVLEHVNNAQRFIGARLLDGILSTLAIGQSLASPPQLDFEFPAQRGVDPPLAPWAYAITPGGAYLRQGSANNKIQIAPGTLLQRVTNARTATASGAGGPGIGGPGSDGLEEVFLAFTFDGTTELAIANGDATNPRVDLLQMSLAYVEGNSLSQVYDSATPPAVTLIGQAANTTRRVQCTLSIKQGTPAASPQYPDPDSGYVAIAGIVVGATYSGAAPLKYYDTSGAVAVVHDQRMPLGIRVHTVQPTEFYVNAANWTDDTFHETKTNSAGGTAIARVGCPCGVAGRVVAISLVSNLDGSITGAAKVAKKSWDNTASISHDLSIDASSLGDTGATGHFLKRTLPFEGNVVSHTPSSGPTVLASATYGLAVPVWTSGQRVAYEEQRIADVLSVFDVTYSGVSLEINMGNTKKLGPCAWIVAEGL